MKSDIREKLLRKIENSGFNLSNDEIVGFYVENIMRNSDGACPIKFSNYENYDHKRGVFRGGFVDMDYDDILNRAKMWYVRAIGSLVLGGFIYATTSPTYAVKNENGIGNGWVKYVQKNG